MAQPEFLDYPKARVGMGSGDLVDVYDVSGQLEDGEQTVSTLRSNPGGSTGGKRSAKLTFKSAISEEGFERDYFGMWAKRKVVQMRLKVPGRTISFIGRLTSPSLSNNTDTFIDNTWTLVGRVVVDKKT